MEVVRSVTGVPIRLTGERWTHIVSEVARRLVALLDKLTADELVNQTLYI